MDRRAFLRGAAATLLVPTVSACTSPLPTLESALPALFGWSLLPAVPEPKPAAPLLKPPVTFVRSPNLCSRRGARIDAIVLHFTESSTTERAVEVLRDPASRVRAHYVVGRDGRIIELVKDKDQAWHAKHVMNPSGSSTSLNPGSA